MEPDELSRAEMEAYDSLNRDARDALKEIGESAWRIKFLHGPDVTGDTIRTIYDN